MVPQTKNRYANRMSVKFKQLLEEVTDKEANGHLDLKNEIEVMRAITSDAIKLYDLANLNGDELVKKYIEKGLTEEQALTQVNNLRNRSTKLVGGALKQVSDLVEKCSRVYVLKESLPKTNIVDLVIEMQSIIHRRITSVLQDKYPELCEDILKKISEDVSNISMAKMSERQATINISI
jgi:hypothetical protein